MLRLALLGPASVQRDGARVSFDTRKAVALLAVLAVEGATQPRDRLAALLWPDADNTRARSALRRTLSVTAAAVGEALVVERASVRLDQTKMTSDVAEFERLVQSGETRSLRNAVDLYRDDFMAGFVLRDAPAFSDWQDQVGDRLRRLLANALAQLVDDDARAGQLEVALSQAQRWLALDPLHEPAHHALIRLHAWRGDRSAAMRQYRTCVRVLDAELGVAPLDETTQLYEAVRRNALPPPSPAESAATDAKRHTAQPRAQVIGRQPQIESLTRLVDEVRLGRGAVATVTGPIGIGKTTLLDEAQRLTADERADVHTIRVRCHPEETTLAYAAVIELCRGVVAREPHVVDTVSPHVRRELSRLLPELAHLDHGLPDIEDPAAAARLYTAIRELFIAVAPAVLVIDDAQWLDHASGEVLAFVIRRLDTTPVAVVLSWANDGTGEPLVVGRAAVDAIAAGRGIQLPLGPLSTAELERALGTDSLTIDISDVFARTEGLPAAVAAYVQAVQEGSDPVAATSDTLRRTARERLRGLSQTAQQVIAAAATLGSRIDLELLRETGGRGDSETVSAVEEAVAAGLLVESPSGEGYELRHEFLRQAALDQTSIARRQLLHHRAATASIRRIGARTPTAAEAGTVARHLQAAGQDADAAGWHWRASVQARALHANADALTSVRAALACGFDPAAGRLAEGELLIVLGRYADAITALELAAAAADERNDDAGTQTQIERRLAEVHHRLGDYEVADAHLDAALTTCGAGTEAAELLAERALVAYRRHADDDAATFARQSLATARGADDPDASARALNVQGMLAVRAGDFDQAERLFRASAEVQGVGPEQTVAALNNLSRLRQHLGRTDDALATAQDALDRGARIGDLHRVAALYTNVADLLRATGREEEAMAHLKQAASLFAAVDDLPQRRPEIWTLVEW